MSNERSVLRVGCSRLAAVFGAHPFVTPYRLWAEMTGRVPPNRGVYAFAGQLYEDAVRAAYLEQHPHVSWDGSRADYRDEPLIHPTAPLSGHPDGILSRPNGTRTVADTKWFVARGMSGTRQIPAYVEYQLRGYMALTDTDSAECIVIWSAIEDGDGIADIELGTHVYHRDGELEQWLLARLCAWHHECIMDDVAPPATGDDVPLLMKLPAKPDIVELSSESAEHWEGLVGAREVCREARAIERVNQRIAASHEAELRQAMGSAHKARIAGTDMTIERRVTKCRDRLILTRIG